MNYLSTYYSIIKKAKSQGRIKLERDDPLYVYYESHHIIPRCIMKDRNKHCVMNQKWNLVLLTAREHFTCHRLLVKITENTKYYHMMLFAVSNFIYRNKDKTKRNSLIYSKIKEKISSATSLEIKRTGRMIGCKNPNFNLKKKFNKKSSKKYSHRNLKGRTWAEAYTTEEINHRLEVRRSNTTPPFGESLYCKSYQHRQNISHAMKGKTKSEDHKQKISESLKGKNLGKTNPNAKRYIVNSPDKNIYIVEGNLYEFCKYHGLNNCCFYPMDGKIRNSGKNKGWSCRYY